MLRSECAMTPPSTSLPSPARRMNVLPFFSITFLERSEPHSTPMIESPREGRGAGCGCVSGRRVVSLSQAP